MVYKFTIPTKGKWKLPSLNDYIKAERTTFRSRNGKLLTKGALLKKQWQEYMAIYIRKDLKSLKITKPVIIHYHYFEENKRRDLGNIHAPAQKFVEDSLQECGVLINDNQKYVVGFSADFDIDSINPRLEVSLETIE